MLVNRGRLAAVWAGTGSLSGNQDADRRLRQRHGLCMSEEQTDEQLVARAQEGNARAFELLVRKYQYKIIQLVSRLVGESDAPDVAQETFIKAYRALNGFRGQSAFYTWLYRIGINTAKNHIVSRGRRPANQDIDISDAEQYGHTEHLSDVDTPSRCCCRRRSSRKSPRSSTSCRPICARRSP